MIKIFRGLLVALLCVAGVAMADEKNILVTSGADRAVPIAVVPFGWQGGNVLPDDMANYRRFSGKFMLKLLGAWMAMGFRRPAVEGVP